MTEKEWIDWCVLRSCIEYPEVLSLDKFIEADCGHAPQIFDHKEFGAIVVFTMD